MGICDLHFSLKLTWKKHYLSVITLQIWIQIDQNHSFQKPSDGRQMFTNLMMHLLAKKSSSIYGVTVEVLLLFIVQYCWNIHNQVSLGYTWVDSSRKVRLFETRSVIESIIFVSLIFQKMFLILKVSQINSRKKLFYFEVYLKICSFIQRVNKLSKYFYKNMYNIINEIADELPDYDAPPPPRLLH